MMTRDIPPLLVNGRFLSRTASGVDRVALELLRTIGAGTAPLSLAVPADVTDDRLAAVADIPFVAIHRGRSKGQRWEQIELRGLEPRATLLSLANMGPLLRRNQLILLHDAQIFLAPQSYSRSFRAWYHIAHPMLGHVARMACTNSLYSLSQLERFGVLPRGKGVVVPLAADHIEQVVADPRTLERHGLTPGSYLLAIGNLAPHKNLAALMQAAGHRPAGAPELVIAGGIDKRVFQNAGLVAPPGVRLIGRVSDAELKALYTHARLFVLPSLTEGFGLPPLEAMTCGCPVIATNAGAVPEVCGDAAWLIDPRDQGAWTAAMVALASDDAARTRLIAAGLERVRRFSWKFAAHGIFDLLDANGSLPCHS